MTFERWNLQGKFQIRFKLLKIYFKKTFKWKSHKVTYLKDNKFLIDVQILNTYVIVI